MYVFGILGLYQEANEKLDLEKISGKAGIGEVPDEQRAILKTWSVVMLRLSDKARFAIRVASLLGNTQIPEELMKEVTRNDALDGMAQIRTFQTVVLTELVRDSSLLGRYRNETEYLFAVPQRVRLLAVADMKEDAQGAVHSEIACSLHNLASILKGRENLEGRRWCLENLSA